MLVRCIVFAVIVVSSATGCSTLGVNDSDKSDGIGWRGIRGKVSHATAGIRQSWHQVTSAEKKESPATWTWASGIPIDAARAGILSPTLPNDAVAHFLPEYRNHHLIAQVAMVRPESGFKIVEIEGQPVRNYDHLITLVGGVARSDRNVKLTLDDGHSTNQQSAPVTVTPETLVALSNAALPNQTPIQINEEGNPWILIRENGIRCKLTARVEREHGLLQVVMSLATCWGDETLLPMEVVATCDGQPLRCLNTADTLELLYGDPKGIRSSSDENEDKNKNSFHVVSSRNDYLVPTNFDRLKLRSAEIAKRSMTPQLPALISIPGLTYPGPAVLGDARVLSRFLLQSQLYHAGEPERVGWIMFSGESLSQGGEVDVDVDVDLGGGMRRFRFTVPSA